MSEDFSPQALQQAQKPPPPPPPPPQKKTTQKKKKKKKKKKKWAFACKGGVAVKIGFDCLGNEREFGMAEVMGSLAAYGRYCAGPAEV